MSIDFAKAHWLHDGIGTARRVLVLDDGSNAGAWLKDGNAGTYAVTRDQSSAFTGAWGYSVKTRGDVPAAGDWCEGYRCLGAAVGSILVMRARLSIPNLAVTEEIRMGLEVVDGLTSWRFGLQYSVSGTEGLYLQADGNWGGVAAWDMVVRSQQWMLWELVVDLETGVYRRAMMNGVETDLGEVSGVADDVSGWKGVRALFRTETDGATMSILCVDDVYVGEYLDV